MAIEAIDWIDAPTLTDAFDSTRYAMGVEFTVSETVPCPGVRWRVPDSLTPVPGTGYVVSLFQDGVGLVRQQAISPVAGAEADFLWTDQGPINLASGNTYVAQVYTERYVFRGSSSYPYASPNAIVTAVRGRLTADVTTAATEATGNTTSSRFYVSPLIGEEDPGGDITGTLSITLPALAAQLAATAPIVGTLSITLPALDALLTGDVEGADADVMGMTAVMDEIAVVLRTVVPRFKVVSAVPPASIGAVPAGIVAFPERILYDQTYRPAAVEEYQRIAVFALAGPPAGINEKTLRNRMAGWMTGAGSIKALLEAHAWTSCEVLDVSDAEIGVITIAGVDYIAALLYMNASGIGA
jgi:hypothetical protein